MSILRDFSLIHGLDHWSRSAHSQTALDVDKGIVQLAWHSEIPATGSSAELPQSAGLAFDPWCRLYRSLPKAGQVERMYWDDAGKASQPEPIFHPPEPAGHGEFKVAGSSQSLQQPVGLVIDDHGHLFIAEEGARRLLVHDILQQRLLQSVPLPGAPLDICSDGENAYILLFDAVIRIKARGKPELIPLAPSISAPARIAASPGGVLYILDGRGSEDARIVPLAREDEWLAVPGAADMLLGDETTLVVARGPGADFLRFRVEAGRQWRLPHLKALHYDGRGIVLTPQGDIGYWTARGFRHATRARPRYLSEGRVVGFQLDSNAYQNPWGRVFIDACIPRGTALKVGWLVVDELAENSGPELPRTPPENAQLLTVNRPDLSPPMPPEKLLENLEFRPLHRRERGAELPWRQGEDENFVTYEAPVIERPGRFLWLVIELSGSSQFTPRIRSVRVEHRAHELLHRLPRLYSKDAVAADFLRRYLAIMEGPQRDLDQQAARRHLLIDPAATPAELLPWLSKFVGLVMDRRWPESVRRRVIEEAIWLFRFRGTLQGLKRFLDLYLEMTDESATGVILIEHFRVRGLGGAFIGESDAEASNSVLGAGFRIGGRIGDEQEVSINDTSLIDAFETHAHRFSVVLPIALDDERLGVVETILQQHRPAHTVYQICSVDTGMRLGSGLHVGLTSLVGNSSGFGRLQIGGSRLGGSDLLGQARQGYSVGNDVLGRNSQVG